MYLYSANGKNTCVLLQVYEASSSCDAFVLWLSIFRESPKYASPRGIPAGDAFHNTWVRTSDSLDGCDPIRSSELKVDLEMTNGIYFELLESFASKSPFAEKMFREWFMLPIVKCG
jgi:hypothetical protein